MNNLHPQYSRLRNVASWSRLAAAIIALACLIGAAAYSIALEAPVGAVRGRVVLADSEAPLADVRITLTPSDDKGQPLSDFSAQRPEVRRVRAVTDERGEFRVPRLVTGLYHLSASTRYHSADETKVWVSEDETSSTALQLTRSEPDLSVAQQQKYFLTTESMRLPVRGYMVPRVAKTSAKAAVKPVLVANRDDGQSTLRVRIFRTRLSEVLRDEKAAKALSQLGNRYTEESAQPLPKVLLHPSGRPSPQLLATREVVVRGADSEGFFHQRLDLGRPGAGLYLVDVARESGATPQVVSAYVQVSDTALIVKKSRRELLAFTVDARSGAPKAGSDVRILRRGLEVTNGRSDADGLARLALPAKADGSLLTLSSFGAHEATVGQYDEGENHENSGPFTTALYTDRPVYRPGGKVSYKGIVRRALESGMRYDIPVGQSVEVEVRDPNGDTLKREKRTANRFGSFWGEVELSPEAPTGTYTVVTDFSGEKQTHDFAVASYKKPEFSATLTPNQTHYLRGQTVEMFLTASLYFGAPLSSGKVRYTVVRAPDWMSDSEAEEDESEAESYGEGEGESGEIVEEGETVLDANGHAVIRFTPKAGEVVAERDAESAPATQMYTVQATVEDAAKREVEAEGRVSVAAGDFRLQVRAAGYLGAPNRAVPVSIEAIDWKNRPVAKAAVEIESRYLQWNADGRPKYFGRRVQTIVTDSKGRASLSLVPLQNGEWRLTARARDAQNRTVWDSTSLWITDDSGGDFASPYGDLSLLTDKKNYRVGETARVLLNTSKVGQTALLSVEGPRLFRVWTVPLTRRSTILRVPILREYGPNVVLNACAVRDKSFVQSSVPLRVQVPERAMQVSVRAEKAKYLPGATALYHVQTRDDKGAPVACEFSLGVVDEAIYALREDDPRLLPDTFYPRRYNLVQTSYSFEPIYLGDVNKSEPAVEMRKKFLDTAFWQPSLQTDERGQATVKVLLPDNLTAWRATVVAQTADTSFGRDTASVAAAKPFSVRLETARFLTEGDQSQISAFVFNDTGREQKATIKLDADGVTADDLAPKVLSIAPNQTAQVMWNISTTSAGLDEQSRARLKVKAWTNEQAGGTRYTDGVEVTLPIRPHGRERVQQFAGQVLRGTTTAHELTLDSKATPSSGRLTIRVTPSIAGAMVGALDYLIGFPYGCIEQTMSRFLPDILVGRALRLSGAGSERERAIKKRLPPMVRDGLARLGRFQHASGGWGWWESDPDDAWMTAYVLYGLSLARDEGYAVSDSMLSRGREAGAKLLQKPLDPKSSVGVRSNHDDTRAFLMYALALSGDVESARAARRTLKAANCGAPALAYLVLLDERLGDQRLSDGQGESKDEAWRELEKRLRSDNAQMLHWTSQSDAAWSDWNQQSATALGLQAMLAHDRSDSRIPSLLLWLMAQRTGDHWSSTRDTSWVLAALCRYLESTSGGVKASSLATISPEIVQVKLNDRVLKDYTLSPASLDSDEWILRVPPRALKAGRNVLSIGHQSTLRGGAPVFYTVQLRQTIGGDELPALSPPGTALRIAREYRRIVPRASNDRWSVASEPTNNQLKAGDRVRVRLTIDAPRDVSYVLIEDAFPAGCEVTERGNAEETIDDWDSWWSSTDVRDDRVAFFARRLSRGRHVIEYNLRAQTLGDYRVLPVMLQAMYAPDVRAESDAARVAVR